MTGWQGLYSSSGVLRDIDAWQGGPGGYAQSGVGYALGPNGKDCGIYGTYYAWGYFDRAPALDSCVTGYDVHQEALETEMVNGAGGSSSGVAIAVGSARATGQAKRPAVMVFDPSTGTRSTRILPGSGDLRAIAFDQPWGPASGSGSAWVAVGSKPLLGANVATIYRSTDRGQTWTAVTPPSGTKSLNDVAYHDAGFVAVGDGGRILHSTDGATWTVGPSPMTAFGIPGSGSVRAIAVDR
jgi:hypothetical protein